MPSETDFAPPRRASTVLALALLLGAGGCDANAVVLVRHRTGDAAVTPADGSVDGAADDAASSDASGNDDGALPDGGTVAAVQILGSGFGAYVGLTVYGRLGPFSSTIASAVIAADGTFVMDFPPVTLTVLNNIYFDLYVDVNADGDCQPSQDRAGGHNVTLVSNGDGTYSADITNGELLPPIPFTCNGL